MLLVSLLVSLVILELFLRVYNPIPTRIKGGKIVLPVNQTYNIKNTSISGLDAIIKHTKNSIGFRGEEKPADFGKYLSIIAVGGSTAEEYYISDNKTWPYLLEQNLKNNFNNVWVNNAGLDGHSTFGHQILLEDYLVNIKPKMIVYLVGINDIERSDLNPGFDNKLLQNSYANWKDWLSKKSEVANLVFNFIRAWNARQHGLSDTGFDITKTGTLALSAEAMQDGLLKQNAYLPGYKARLEKLIQTTRANGIEPVLITQPLLWGEGKDPVTGVDLETAKINDSRNGKSYWNILELYNNQTRQVAAETHTFLIDLAHELPKSSAYFYDGVHYTNAGAAKIADILSADLTIYLKAKYNSFSK